MGMKVISDGSGTVTRLKDMSKRTQDVSPAWPRVGRFMSGVARKQFSTKGAFLNTKWKPLKPEYRLWKVRNGYSRSILVKTGDMRSGFTGRPMDIEEYHRDYAIFGSSDPIAKFHQYGTKRNGKKVLPARKILVTTREVRTEVRDMIAQYISKGKK